MNEYIKREDAIRAIMEYIRDGCDESDEFIDGTYKAKLIVEEDVPSVELPVRCVAELGFDVDDLEKAISDTIEREIIRCKDCKWADVHKSDDGVFCEYHCAPFHKEDFCSYGESEDYVRLDL